MNTETLANTGEQVRLGLSEFAGKVKGISDDVTDLWRTARADAGRNARRAKIAAEERIAETRHRIKSRPLSSVAIVASGAFLLGGVVGWIVANNHR
jgi:ElaB/YqjD/DUF883 family membrane-anchored ribosome-binding protein